LAEWISERDPDLGAVLARDAGRMANVLASQAAKHARVSKWVERVFGVDGPIAILRAFGPFLRELISRLPSLPSFNDEPEFPVSPEDLLGAHGIPGPPA